VNAPSPRCHVCHICEQPDKGTNPDSAFSQSEDGKCLLAWRGFGAPSWFMLDALMGRGLDTLVGRRPVREAPPKVPKPAWHFCPGSIKQELCAGRKRTLACFKYLGHLRLAANTSPTWILLNTSHAPLLTVGSCADALASMEMARWRWRRPTARPPQQSFPHALERLDTTQDTQYSVCGAIRQI
jgi:hypothetical protein